MVNKYAYLLVLGISIGILSGCATASQATARNREHLLKLSIGMSKEEAINIMGKKRFSAGNLIYSETPLMINNPYRSEIVAGRDKTLEIIYYVTDVKKNDGVITDDELTPLVFEDGKLIGWGQTFLRDSSRMVER